MADSDDRNTPKWAAALALAGVASAYVLSFVLPAESDRVWCALRATTGVPCPLCGMSRAFIRISHGGPGAAFDLHALSPVAYAAGIFLALLLAGELAGSARLNIGVLGRPVRLAAAVVIVFAVFWAVRLVVLWTSGALAAAFRSSPVGHAFLGG